MRKILILFFFLSGFIRLEANTSVLVSIIPQKFLVERIGGEYVHVEVLVPPGANSHTYDPAPRQVIAAKKATIWFRLGESFEAKLVPSLQKNTRIIDQRDGIELIKEGCGCCHAKEAYDPHIWLSPKLLKIQAQQIAHILSEQDPEHMHYFGNNLSSLEQELDELDQECASLLLFSTQRYLLVSHPAFGYLCRDYSLNQLSIEMEGREPTPKYLTELVLKARMLNIQTVFLQKQHNPKGGKRIAKELGAKTVYIDPYLENVIENLRTLAKLFSCQ